MHLQCRRPWFTSWVGKIHWRRDTLPTPVFLSSPCGSSGKESPCNMGDLDSIPGLGKSARERNGYSLHYSGLENSMDCIAHGVSKSWTRLSDFHLHIRWPFVCLHWRNFYLSPLFIFLVGLFDFFAVEL